MNLKLPVELRFDAHENWSVHSAEGRPYAEVWDKQIGDDIVSAINAYPELQRTKDRLEKALAALRVMEPIRLESLANQINASDGYNGTAHDLRQLARLSRIALEENTNL